MKNKMIVLQLMLLLSGINAGAQWKRMVWSDEFNYTGLPDSTKWSYDLGSHGWGNNELQHYTALRLENARVENGNLVIEAHKENLGGARYTSARLVTKNKGDWKNVLIEVRARLPRGTGVWPAIWMLPTEWKYGGWPNSGEIDIMEHVGYLPDSVYASVHTESFNHSIGTQKTAGIRRDDLSEKFHTYAVKWQRNKLRFYIDGRRYHKFRNTRKGPKEWPFDEEFHLLLNIAIGGNWGGKMGVDDNIFPQRMEVDWVRVYK